MPSAEEILRLLQRIDWRDKERAKELEEKYMEMAEKEDVEILKSKSFPPKYTIRKNPLPYLSK